MKVRRKIPEWSLPLLPPSPLKGAKGGRASGKSHYFAERMLDLHYQNPNFKSVCIREIQKSITFSSFQLLKDKIIAMGLTSRFEVLKSEIRDRLGDGIIIFQGMQDHTADSIKSLEGFDLAWFEEAQRASKNSLDLLTPTILRKKGAECWFSWNPNQPDDAIEALSEDEDFILASCTYLDNPFREDSVDREANKMRARDVDAYDHIWLGGFNVKSDAQVYGGIWSVQEFEPMPDWIPLFGLDWGFSQDPTVAAKMYLVGDKIFISHEAGKVGLELDDTAEFMINKIPEIDKYEVEADSARPESISHVKRNNSRGKCLPKITGVKKWPGSVEDGVEFVKSHDIVVHPRCKQIADELRLYKYKIDKRTGQILPIIVDANNHYMDSIRYALSKFIKKAPQKRIRSL